MSAIYTSADQLIGHTPLLELTHIEKAHSLKAKILAKLEYFNPAGSVKDRIAIRSRMGVVSMDLQQQFHDDTKVCEVICSGFFNSLDVFRNQTVTEEMNRASYESAVALGIDDIYDREIQNLSLGEMRRALIARALVTKPDLLVLDEPMTGLDIVMKSKFRSMFDILIDAGVSIVMITHELTDIPESGKRVVMVKDGGLYRMHLRSER